MTREQKTACTIDGAVFGLAVAGGILLGVGVVDPVFFWIGLALIALFLLIGVPRAVYKRAHGLRARLAAPRLAAEVEAFLDAARRFPDKPARPEADQS